MRSGFIRHGQAIGRAADVTCSSSRKARGRRHGILLFHLQREGRPSRPYLATEAMERTGVFSPDERWVA